MALGFLQPLTSQSVVLSLSDFIRCPSRWAAPGIPGNRGSRSRGELRTNAVTIDESNCSEILCKNPSAIRIWDRSRPSARSANFAGVILATDQGPQHGATRLTRMSEATAPSLMFASSKTLWMRLASRVCSDSTGLGTGSNPATRGARTPRHETAVQQPALQQLSDPLGIAHVRLRPGTCLTWRGLTRIVEPALQDVPDRLPEHAGRFHGHVGHTQASR